jgi:hypothetical protein
MSIFLAGSDEKWALRKCRECLRCGKKEIGLVNPKYTEESKMSLRPPEECKKHAWRYLYGDVASNYKKAKWECRNCKEVVFRNRNGSDLPVAKSPNPPRKSPAICEKP